MAQSPLNTPILWINTYFQEKLTAEFAGLNLPEFTVPFFPTGPSTIDELTETFPSSSGTMCVYDRMFKMRRKAFPHIKCEQILYYFYALQSAPTLTMIQIQEIAFRLFDRGDESAEDINAYFKGRTIDVADIDGSTITLSPNFYFHEFKVFQLEESRDIIDFGTARTYAGNKIILDYDYHYIQDYNDPSF